MALEFLTLLLYCYCLLLGMKCMNKARFTRGCCYCYTHVAARIYPARCLRSRGCSSWGLLTLELEHKHVQR
jgi:hypothetical protein